MQNLQACIAYMCLHLSRKNKNSRVIERGRGGIGGQSGRVLVLATSSASESIVVVAGTIMLMVPGSTYSKLPGPTEKNLAISTIYLSYQECF